MKKNILYLIVILFAAVAICSCSKDDEDEPAPAKIEFKAPCTTWHCDIQEVRSYMKTIGSFMESDPVPYVNGSISYSFYNQNNISYNYNIGEDGLVQSTVGYWNMNDNFDTFFNTITANYGITNWEEIHYANDTETWGVVGSNKSTSIHIGRNDNHNVMFASFECSDEKILKCATPSHPHQTY